MIRKPGISSLSSGLLAGIMLIFLIAAVTGAGVPTINKGVVWEELNPGLTLATLNGPRISKYSDSKVTVLRIDPAYYHFEMVNASQSDSVQRTVVEWCDLHGLDGAINAGMYSLKDHISGVGYMRNHGHINNPVYKENFNAMAVFNPSDSLMPAFKIVDMVNEDWKSIVPKYHCCFQSIRMIDNRTQPVFWKQRPVLYCSMSVLAVDKSGHVLYVFARSPYTANEMTRFLLASSLNIQTAMYLEGGPEASIYVRTPGREIVKFGSFVSYSKPDDKNEELRKMPNILGFKKK